MITKDSGFRIRIQRDLRRQFVAACRAQDKPAAQVLREFMRIYVDQHGGRRADTAADRAHSPRRLGLVD